MSNENISIQERTENFAIRVVKAYSELNKRHFDDAGKILSKQFLRSGTSIGQILQRANLHSQELTLYRSIL